MASIVRQKEHAFRPLFAKRSAVIQRIPHFWPTVFLNGPDDLQQLYSPSDMAVLAALKSFSVERYQITSEHEGEPRSLRFTFEFDENEFFEDTKLVKEFEFRPQAIGPGDLISKPVPIKWKSKKKDLTEGLLGAAVDLYEAEQAMKFRKHGHTIDMVDREGLWQHEKLREKLAKLQESDMEPSIMSWFGFRGAVARKEAVEKPKENGANGHAGVENEDEDEEEDDGLLEVEIFPAGEEVAVSLAEDLWPDAMDYYMRDNADPALDFDGFEEEDSSVDSDEVPDLVPEELRPKKRQRTD
jgi:hypothetical protein